MDKEQKAGAIDIEPRDHVIPEGMKLWQGGEDAPVDWDGGPVWFRAGRLSGKGEGPKAGPDGKWIEGWGNWHHLNGWDSTNKAAVSGKMDVIAYTPASTSEQQAVPVAQEALDRLRGMISENGRLNFRSDVKIDDIGKHELETVRMAIAAFAALEKRGAEAVIAYHVAICSPKGVVPDDTLYDAKMAADIQAALDAGIPIRAALNARDAA